MSTLNSNEARDLLIGGYALGCYIAPRATENLDVWIDHSGENIAKLGPALREFGFAPEESTYSHLRDKRGMLRLGVPPVRIEILTRISGVEWGPCAERATLQTIDGLAVPVISLEDLRANKLASGRPKDMADIAAIDEFSASPRPALPTRRGRRR